MPDEEHRRSSDPRIDQIEQTLTQIANRVDGIDVSAAIRNHVRADHSPLHGTVEEQQALLKRIVEALDGFDETDLSGNVVGHVPGLTSKVDIALLGQERQQEILDILDHRTNGGVVITQRIQHRPIAEWTRTEKIAAGSLAGFLFFSSLPGIVFVIRWIAELIVQANI